MAEFATSLVNPLIEILDKLLIEAIESFARNIGKLLDQDGANFLWRLMIRCLSEDPNVQKVMLTATSALFEALSEQRQMAFVVVGGSLILLSAAVSVPLAVAALRCRHARVFISFNRSREDQAAALQRALEQAEIGTARLPFDPKAGHQSVVTGTTDGIRNSDFFVCLPGKSHSYVESEVGTAAGAGKPIVFIVAQHEGALPDTADKRYPVFRLEALADRRYAPLAQFFAYVAGDLRSSWALCRSALRHPAMSLSVTTLTVVMSLLLAGVFGFSAVHVFSHRSQLNEEFPGIAQQLSLVLAANAAVMCLLAGIAAAALFYASLVTLRVVGQVRARRRMRLVAVRATFRRDDWVGVVPGMEPGSALFESFFESSPLAHHERAARQKRRP